MKSQINPHFLFNTLNNIYAYSQIGDEKAAPMLERLSGILRYMGYDCEADSFFLKKELAAIDDLLEIHKMKMIFFMILYLKMVYLASLRSFLKQSR